MFFSGEAEAERTDGDLVRFRPISLTGDPLADELVAAEAEIDGVPIFRTKSLKFLIDASSFSINVLFGEVAAEDSDGDPLFRSETCESGFGIDIGDNEGDRKLRPSDFSLSGDVKVEDDEGDRTFPLDALGSRGESVEILPGVEEG